MTFKASGMAFGKTAPRTAALALVACLVAASAPATFAATLHVANGFTFAAGGDLLGPYQPLGQAPDPALQAVAGHFRSADLGFANMEGSVFDQADFTGWPAAETGGGFPLSPAAVAKDLRALGITAVSKANNHATDFGTEGLVATLRSLRQAGIAEAGAGTNLAEARAPVYLRTPKGMAALVSTASTFTPMSVAGAVARHGRYIHAGRPGISALHVRQVHLLPQPRLDALRMLLAGIHVSSPEQSWSGELGQSVIGETAGPELDLGSAMFRAGSDQGLASDVNPEDLDAVLTSIREARANARFVLFSMHAHE
ncbi:MAG: CapA family protein, partial [Rhodanobacter sp.]